MPVTKPVLTGLCLLAAFCVPRLSSEGAEGWHTQPRLVLGRLSLVSQAAAAHAPVKKPAVSTASQRALDAAKRDRAALLARKAREASLIDAQRKAQAKATRDAAIEADKARHFSALTDRAASELAATEKTITALTDDIARLTAQQEAQRAALAQRRASLQAILPVALRLSRYPGTSFVALSGQADDSVQGLSLIAGLTRLTARQADDLHGQQVLLDQTAQELAQRNSALEKARATLARLRDVNARKMDQATHQQEEAEARARQARDDIAAATAKAATLDDALSAIDKVQASLRARMEEEARALERANQKAKAEAMSAQARKLSESHGSGVSHGGGHGPVSGTVTTFWHQSTESGPATGLTYAASAGSAVSAPCAGQVDFAGPFRSFGNMVILDCGRHYRFVLSGLGALSVSSGQAVGRHETLGSMGPGGGALFVQLRSGSSIIDPRPYL
ncbi:murein hydrolase activator EnvC family protein [Asaia krungthepensis]|uniref:M23ase beta-sheet core domain-containing protein n=1 Tax=Asaia krungthepensis NRIC 0535 TaxID=1307925 RepID=A0ABQ0PYY7_9PROT|nr:peptidoglycan DD-metalloendopeptidase family protein [Asaia krungthepensis]GBQ85079.1 hypothetical protein AA0535_0668 [Asaia krungthepensis NRIC 0535]